MEIEKKLEKIEERLVRLEKKIDDSMKFTKEAMFFLGDKVLGEHEERLAAIENS